MAMLIGRVRTIAVIPNEERIRTEDVSALIARGAEDDAPITRTQLARFLAEPDGVLLPAELLGIQQVPWRDGAPLLADDGALAVGSGGEIVYLATDDDHAVVRVGEHTTILPSPRIPAAHGASYDGYDAHLIGLDGVSPVVCWDPRRRIDPSRTTLPHPTAYDGPPMLVTNGSACIIEEALPMSHVCWHPKVGVAYIRVRQNAQALPVEAHACVNGVAVQHLGASFVDVFGYAGDGTLYGAWHERGPSPRPDDATPRVQRLTGFDYPRAIAPVGQSAVVIVEESNGDFPIFAAFNLDGSRRHDRFGPHRYLGHYAELLDGRAVFIGHRSHADHDGQWWIVNGVPGPRFARVSTLFKRDGAWCYYAQTDCVDTRLIAMRLHTPSAHEEAIAADGR